MGEMDELQELQEKGGMVYRGALDTRPRDDQGRIVDRRYGMRSLLLGLLALGIFGTGIGVVLGLVSIFFGIWQLNAFSAKKGRWEAFAGIACALLSIVLFAALIAAVAGNPSFTRDFLNYFEQSGL